MTLQRFKTWFDNSILTLFLILLVGNPMLFTSLTRSVFEVNKLLLLRIVTLVCLVLWLLWSIVSQSMDEEDDEAKGGYYRFFGLKWKKIGLEIPVLLWVVLNIVSTIFSENIRISIIGAYDRWEGIVTVINYVVLFYLFAKLVRTRRQFSWMLIGTLVPAALSSVYGIFQSVGWDFMHWSVDPTARVFACINNPVHFCAYVGMIVPVGVGWLLYLSSKNYSDKDPSSRSVVIGRIVRWGSLMLSQLFMQWFMLNSNPFGIENVVMIALLGLGWYIQISFPDLLPNKKVVGIWIAYVVGVLALSQFGLIPFQDLGWPVFWLLLVLYYILTPAPNWIVVLKRCVFACTGILFYAQFLSFSRATWVGFVGAMTIFYLFSFNLFRIDEEKHFIRDMLATAVSVGFLYMYGIFHLESHGVTASIIIALVLIGFCAYHYLSVRPLHEKRGYESLTTSRSVLTEGALVTVVSALFFMVFTLDFSLYFSNFVAFPLAIFLGLYCVSMVNRMDGALRHYVSRLVVILAFLRLQYVGTSLMQVVLYGLLVWMIYLLALKGSNALKREAKIWSLGLLIIFAVVLLIPTIPGYMNNIFEKDLGKLRATENMKFRVGAYARDALKGTARTSMWKTSIPWIQDYWLVGSGPDTTKYMYPVYRLPDYGILEGGHNFTPDRLHNEYLNTLATKGIPASAVYYLGVMLGWFVLLLKGFFRFQRSPYRFLIASMMTGVMVYLGQVMFNFGVVATLVLFYIFMGLGLAIVSHEDFTHESDG